MVPADDAGRRPSDALELEAEKLALLRDPDWLSNSDTGLDLDVLLQISCPRDGEDVPEFFSSM